MKEKTIKLIVGALSIMVSWMLVFRDSAHISTVFTLLVLLLPSIPLFLMYKFKSKKGLQILCGSIVFLYLIFIFVNALYETNFSLGMEYVYQGISIHWNFIVTFLFYPLEFTIFLIIMDDFLSEKVYQEKISFFLLGTSILISLGLLINPYANGKMMDILFPYLSFFTVIYSLYFLYRLINKEKI